MTTKVLSKKLRIGLVLCLMGLVPSVACETCVSYETVENVNCIGPDGVVHTSDPFRCVAASGGECGDEGEDCKAAEASHVSALCGGSLVPPEGLQSRLMPILTIPAKPADLTLGPADVAAKLTFTPVADGTVVQSVTHSSNSQADIVNTISPSTNAHMIQIGATRLDVVGRTPAFNFQGYGLATGGLLDFSGTSLLGEFSKTLPVPPLGNASPDHASSGTVGIVEFDLGDLKTALQQLNVTPSAIRATLRLTPIRSLDMFDLLAGIPRTSVPSTTRVVLLDMTDKQKDLTVDYRDFPGFSSPGVSSLNDLAAAIRNAPPEQSAIVRTDLFGLPARVVFDVTQAVQRDLQTSNATTGFQVASEFNGTGLIFADSSNYITGIAEMTAPQLIIELAGFNPPGPARFVSSATNIPFDSLALDFRSLELVTINNVGANAGTISIDVTSGADIFGLMTPDGRQLSAQGNTATIGAGEALTVAVTFKPPDGQGFKGEVQITDTTGGRHDLIDRVALTGSTMLVGYSRDLPRMTAPIGPLTLPDVAARVGDLNGDGLIDAVDVMQLSAIIAGRVTAPQPGTVAFAVADVNGDGAINSADLSVLADALARNLDALPRLRPQAANGLTPTIGSAGGPSRTPMTTKSAAAKPAIVKPIRARRG